MLVDIPGLPSNDDTLQTLPTNDVLLSSVLSNQVMIPALPSNEVMIPALPSNKAGLSELPSNNAQLFTLPSNEKSSVPIETVFSNKNTVAESSLVAETNINDVAETNIDNVAENNINNVAVNNINKVAENNISDVAKSNVSVMQNNVSCLSSDINIGLLYNEIIALRKSNDALHELVSSLRSDNKKMISMFDKLQEAFMKLSVSCTCYPVGSSPKRKKSVVNTGTISSNVNQVSLSNDTANANVLDVNKLGKSLRNTGAKPLSYAAVVCSSPTPNNTNNVSSEDWVQVSRKNQKVSEAGANPILSKTPLLIGAGSNTELGVIDKKKWLHLSSFKNSVTCEDIISYVEKHAGINRNNINCYKLVKKDIDASSLKFINFKLGISACFVDKVLDASVWPTNIKIRHLDFLEKPAVSLQT